MGQTCIDGNLLISGSYIQLLDVGASPTGIGGTYVGIDSGGTLYNVPLGTSGATGGAGPQGPTGTTGPHGP